MNKKIPKFKTLDEAREFWQDNDFADFAADTNDATIKFVRRQKTQITFRLDPADVEKLKEIAGSKGLSYSTLIRMWVKEKLAS